MDVIHEPWKLVIVIICNYYYLLLQEHMLYSGMARAQTIWSQRKSSTPWRIDGKKILPYRQVSNQDKLSPTPSITRRPTFPATSNLANLLRPRFEALLAAIMFPRLKPPCLTCLHSLRGHPCTNSTEASDQEGAVSIATFPYLRGRKGNDFIVYASTHW